MQEQQESQMCISNKLEEQMKSLNQTIGILEKDMQQCQHNSELYKRQALENIHFIQDLRVNTQKYLFQLKTICI